MARSRICEITFHISPMQEKIGKVVGFDWFEDRRENETL